MKIYLAPLEGITGYTYRRALYNCFGGFDKYFIPFIMAYELYLQFSHNPNDNVAHLAHIGGGIFGYFFIKWWKRKTTSYF